MTLKNKNGSPYRLSAPNPVMNTQEIWGSFKTHNLSWNGEVSKDENQVVPTTDFQVKETFFSALDQAKSDIKVSEEMPQKQQEIDKTPLVIPDLKKEEIQTSNNIEKTFIYCLPAELRTKQDSLYGDSYTTVQYGNPTSFEGVILKQQDLFIEIWTDSDSINSGSILFPKQGFKRWWRVQEKEKKAGGWILSATPSDKQPSFDL